MATSLSDVRISYNFRPVQIEGPADASVANFITFAIPAEIRRVEVATAAPATLIQIWISRDGSADPEQQVLLAQTHPLCPNHQWLIHTAPFNLSKPQTQVQETPINGGKLYLITSGGGNWTMTVEARG